MKKALIFSDSHGNIEPVLEIIRQHRDVDLILHAGDIEGDQGRLRNATPKQTCIVRGNCDFSADLPPMMTIEFAGKTIVLCHGHRYMNGGSALMGLKYLGQENKADLVVFGHTHVPYLEEQDGMYIFNPGSICRPRQEGHVPTYGLLEVNEEGDIHLRICHRK